MPQSIREGYLTRQELAVELGVSERAIGRWEREGKGPPRVLLGRRILYKRESVEKWLGSREAKQVREAPAPTPGPPRPKAPSATRRRKSK
jgi:predicted DNA-binding transcriptional regulator AlpA